MKNILEAFGLALTIVVSAIIAVAILPWAVYVANKNNDAVADVWLEGWLEVPEYVSKKFGA